MTIAIRIILVLVIQVAVLGGMLGLHLTTLCTGRPIIIMTRDVDTNELYPGNIVSLDYAIGNIDLSNIDGSDSFAKYDPVYVILQRFDDRRYGDIWYARRLENDLEGQRLASNEVAIRGIVTRVVTDRATFGRVDRPPRIEIEYGIEDYQVRDEDANEFGRRPEGIDIAVQLLVDSSGRATIQSMLSPSGIAISAPSIWTGLCQ